MNQQDNPEYVYAMTVALKALKSRDRFASDIRLRCKRAGCKQEATELVLQELSEKSLIDDTSLAKRTAERWSQEKKWGKRRIYLELRKRGAPQESANLAISEIEENINKALALIRGKPKDKAARALWSAGFSKDTIQTVLETIEQPESEVL